MMRIRIQVNNNEPFTDLSVRRVSPDNPKMGDICIYNVENIINGKLADYICDIECEFGDGSKLAQKVLERINDANNK